jgi:hypothetical protein
LGVLHLGTVAPKRWRFSNVPATTHAAHHALLFLFVAHPQQLCRSNILATQETSSTFTTPLYKHENTVGGECTDEDLGAVKLVPRTMAESEASALGT